MTAIATILSALAGVESGLRVSVPIPAEIKRAYATPPPRDVVLSDTPCWINTFDLLRVERHATHGTIRIHYAINAQLFIEDADLDRGGQIAAAFLAAAITALNTNITLSGTVNQSDLRGGSPTLAMLDWAGKGYPGLNLFVDVMTQEAVQFA